MPLTLALFGWLLLGLPSRSFGQTIPIQLLFDGKPLETTARPEFSCLDTNQNTWIACTVTTARWPDRYVMARLAPGRYVLHVTINENRRNPARFPGDYDVFHRFEVTPDAPVVVERRHGEADTTSFAVGQRLRHGRDAHAAPVGQAALVTSRQSSTAAVTLSWDAVASGATYTYFVVATRDSPYERGPEVVRGTTARTSITLRLPESLARTLLRVWTLGTQGWTPGRRALHARLRSAGVDRQVHRARPIARGNDRPCVARIAPPSASASQEILRTEWRALPKPSWWDSVPRHRWPSVLRRPDGRLAVRHQRRAVTAAVPEAHVPGHPRSSGRSRSGSRRASS